MRRRKQNLMYAKMYLVTPMVYEKLKRCLDKSDVATLDRINKPYISNVQTQVFDQQQPPSFKTFHHDYIPPPIPPLSTSEKKIENIIQHEMSIPQSVAANEPEFEEVSDPYMDESFGFDRNPIQWDRPITSDIEVQTHQPIMVDSASQTQQPFTTSSGTQTYPSFTVESQTQTDQPETTLQLPTGQFTQTMQSIEAEPMELPALEHQQIPELEYQQIPQLTFQPTITETVYGHRTRKSKNKTDGHLRKKFGGDLKKYVPPVRSSRYNRLDRLPGPHAQHFGEVLRSEAVSTPRRPAISEVVFSGTEMAIPPIQQFEQPLQLTHQQRELPAPRQLDQLQGPPRILPLTYQQGELLGPESLESLQGPPQVPQITYQQSQPQVGPGSSQLIYRERPALTYQRKRNLSESSYVPPEKILTRPYEGVIPDVKITPATPQRQMKLRQKQPQRLRTINEEPKEAKTKTYQCDLCGILLSTNYSLNRHKERELRRIQAVEQQQPTNFNRWLESYDIERGSDEVEAQPGQKRTATTAKLSNLRRTKRVANPKKSIPESFPNWFLRPPEKV
jgi:hypothetical protein